MGAWGDFGAFSLQASKTLTGGEGGILITDDREMYERAMSMGTHPQRLVAELELPEFRRRIDSLAFNFRMHTASAAIANRQLDRLDEWTGQRVRNAERLYAAVADLELLEPQRPPEDESKHAYYHIPFLHRPDRCALDRDGWIAALEAEGVPAGCYVKIPLHLRPRIANHDWIGRGFPWSLHPSPPSYAAGDCPVAEALCHTEWQVKASFHTDDDRLIDEIAAAIHKVAAHADEIAEARIG